MVVVALKGAAGVEGRYRCIAGGEKAIISKRGSTQKVPYSCSERIAIYIGISILKQKKFR